MGSYDAPLDARELPIEEELMNAVYSSYLVCKDYHKLDQEMEKMITRQMDTDAYKSIHATHASQIQTYYQIAQEYDQVLNYLQRPGDKDTSESAPVATLHIARILPWQTGQEMDLSLFDEEYRIDVQNTLQILREETPMDLMPRHQFESAEILYKFLSLESLKSFYRNHYNKLLGDGTFKRSPIGAPGSNYQSIDEIHKHYLELKKRQMQALDAYQKQHSPLFIELENRLLPIIRGSYPRTRETLGPFGLYQQSQLHRAEDPITPLNYQSCQFQILPYGSGSIEDHYRQFQISQFSRELYPPGTFLLLNRENIQLHCFDHQERVRDIFPMEDLLHQLVQRLESLQALAGLLDLSHETLSKQRQGPWCSSWVIPIRLSTLNFIESIQSLLDVSEICALALLLGHDLFDRRSQSFQHYHHHDFRPIEHMPH